MTTKTMETTTMSNFKRTIILVIAILLGALLNFNSANAMAPNSGPSARVTRMYANACKNLQKKHRNAKNTKVRVSKRPLWR